MEPMAHFLFPCWLRRDAARGAYARVGSPATTDGGDIDESERKAQDALFGLPIELWHMIWRHAAQASQAHFVVARVCRSWRSAVLDLHRTSGMRSMQRGAEACRIFVARDAVDAGNAGLLAWALKSACSAKPTPLACARLWDRLAVSGSLACARVLRDVGPWPPECVAGCPCRYRFSVASSEDSCRTARIMTTVVANRHVDLFRALVRWKIADRTHWCQPVLSRAVARGHTDILDVLVEERTFATFTRSLGAFPKSRFYRHPLGISWIEWAAYCNKPESIVWLAGHGIGAQADCDNALVVAARHGSVNAVVWLCEHGHLERFAAAFVGALEQRRIKTARAMMPYAALAYAHAQIQGDTIPEAVVRARVASVPLCARAVPLLDALLALDKTDQA
ncbi:Ankyrin repeat domain containing protein [Pandoravirus neocaledonia]|uniref:Ankyrin repeat domain containing protein n=1 Tax=Pandoravirus neocaledonia TaxID=2107708 RepID=A0A2U7UDB3_9VIRU|nr:Ankyrin repeat domain containing protein [Pandoravirus neocaledonia]AVK76417.1 Ankyrin repeat domain containing protein [Pandoravirus neocaledonia]